MQKRTFWINFPVTLTNRLFLVFLRVANPLIVLDILKPFPEALNFLNKYIWFSPPLLPNFTFVFPVKNPFFDVMSFGLLLFLENPIHFLKAFQRLLDFCSQSFVVFLFNLWFDSPSLIHSGDEFSCSIVCILIFFHTLSFYPILMHGLMISDIVFRSGWNLYIGPSPTTLPTLSDFINSD